MVGHLAPVPRAHQKGVSLSFSLERPQIRDTGTPTGRVLARIELVCCEILAGDVPRGGAADWCRRLIVKKPCGVSSPLTEQARRLALALNVCDRAEAQTAASRLLLHCTRIRAQHAAGLKHASSTRKLRLRTSRTG